MIPKKIQAAFNAQIKAEMDSAYLYLSMAAYFKSQTLDGMEHWMKVQAKEEMGHAMKFFDFILERGGRVELAGLAEPKAKWSSALDAFKNTYEHEQVVTGKIHALVKLAESQDDPASSNFLQWFVNEQVEEEANALEIVVTLERVGASGAGLIMLDRELGKRE